MFGRKVESHWEFWHRRILHTAYSPNVAGDSAAVLNGRHLDLAISQTAVAKDSLAKSSSLFLCVCWWLLKQFFIDFLLDYWSLNETRLRNVRLVATVFHREKKKKNPKKRNWKKKNLPKIPEKIYIYTFIYKLKNLVQMSCYI